MTVLKETKDDKISNFLVKIYFLKCFLLPTVTFFIHPLKLIANLLIRSLSDS